MPSPRFWKTCGSEVNGAVPIQFAPSPPICVTASVRRSGSQTAMPWQPMPPSAIEPSGTTVEVLCGQPEQKLGRRISCDGGATGTAAPRRGAQQARVLRRATLEPAADHRGDAARGELALGGHERRAGLVALAEQAAGAALSL